MLAGAAFMDTSATTLMLGVAIALGLLAGCGDDSPVGAGPAGGASTGGGGVGGAPVSGGGGSAEGGGANEGGGGANQGGGGANEGGGGANEGGAPSFATFAEYCDLAEDKPMCALDGDACLANEACVAYMLREETMHEILACMLGGCEQDECFESTYDDALSAVGESFVPSCEAAGQNCRTMAEWCPLAHFLSDAVVTELAACTTAPTCAEMDDCLGALQPQFEACEDWL